MLKIQKYRASKENILDVKNYHMKKKIAYR